MVRNINVTTMNNRNNIVINPCIRVFNKTTDEEYLAEPRNYDNTPDGSTITLTPHLSLSVPTEIIVVKGRDINLGNDGVFDMCSQSPQGDYGVQVIKFNSFSDAELKKYFLDESISANDLILDASVAKTSVDSSVSTDDYNDPDKNDKSRYLTPYMPISVYSYEIGYRCIRCTISDVTNFLTQNQDVTSSDIAEMQAAFIRAERNSFDSIILKRILVNSSALYPSENLYPSTSLFPKPSDIINIYRSLWYNFSIDTQENVPYTKVRCVKKIGDTNVVYESIVVNSNENNIYDLSSNNYASAIPADGIQTILDSIADALREIYSNLATIKMKGLPYIEAGDYVNVHTKDGVILICVLRHRITGIQSLIDTIDVM